jgi:hypothetical protein
MKILTPEQTARLREARERERAEDAALAALLAPRTSRLHRFWDRLLTIFGRMPRL